MERVEQYITNPLRCYKCQKYGQHEDNCRGCEVCRKCGQQNPDYNINDCQFPCKCANCGGDHVVCATSCESWRQEKELLTLKHRNNIPYYEARKLVVGSKTTTYFQAVQPNKSPYNKYETIVKTLSQANGKASSIKSKPLLIPPEIQMHRLDQWILQKTKTRLPKHRPDWGKPIKRRKRQ